jgi:hypothetical protein
MKKWDFPYRESQCSSFLRGFKPNDIGFLWHYWLTGSFTGGEDFPVRQNSREIRQLFASTQATD